MADEEVSESPVQSDGQSSEWQLNWTGAIALVIIAAIGLVGWRWLAGSGSEAVDSLSVVATTNPPSSADVSTLPTSTRPATTTLPPVPSTAEPAPTTTVAADRRVLIRGEMKPCRFGDNCLVASFTIEGFDEHPGRFTCIYPNSQSEFSFRALGVDDACLTADQGDTLTIEVGGVKSATISEENLDGF